MSLEDAETDEFTCKLLTQLLGDHQISNVKEQSVQPINLQNIPILVYTYVNTYVVPEYMQPNATWSLVVIDSS